MSMHPADYFLMLADGGSTVARFDSAAGNAFLVSGADTVRMVLRPGAAFACPTHPYALLDGCLRPLGRIWLGLGTDPAQTDALLGRAHGFFEAQDFFGNGTVSATAEAPSAAAFCLDLKAMFFDLSCRLLFDLQIGEKSFALARAADAIEEKRAGRKVSEKRHAAALAEFAWLTAQIQWTTPGATSSKETTHAVRETLLSAAVPPTYALLWTLLLLGRNLAAQDRIRQAAAAMDRSASPSLDALRTGHAAAAIKEALRLYPPVWALSRTSIGPQCLGGIQVAAGDAVVVSPYALHRMGAAWENPARFMPERFAAGTPKPQGYLPFGAGTRTCPAAKWNSPMLALALHAFLRRHAITVNRVPRPRPLVALRPALNFKVSLRDQPQPRRPV